MNIKSSELQGHLHNNVSPHTHTHTKYLQDATRVKNPGNVDRADP